MFESAVAKHSVCPSFDGIGIEHVGFFVNTDGGCCSCACLLFQLYQELLLYGLPNGISRSLLNTNEAAALGAVLPP